MNIYFRFCRHHRHNCPADRWCHDSTRTSFTNTDYSLYYRYTKTRFELGANLAWNFEEKKKSVKGRITENWVFRHHCCFSRSNRKSRCQVIKQTPSCDRDYSFRLDRRMKAFNFLWTAIHFQFGLSSGRVIRNGMELTNLCVPMVALMGWAFKPTTIWYLISKSEEKHIHEKNKKQKKVRCQMSFSWFSRRETTSWKRWAKKNNVGRYQRPIDFTKRRYSFVVVRFDFPNSCIRWPTKRRKDVERIKHFLPASRLECEAAAGWSELLGSKKKGSNNGTTRRSRPDCCLLRRSCRGLHQFPRGLAIAGTQHFSSVASMFQTNCTW